MFFDCSFSFLFFIGLISVVKYQSIICNRQKKVGVKDNVVSVGVDLLNDMKVVP